MLTERTVHGKRDDDGHWTCWFADSPQTSFGGRTAISSLVRMFATLSPPCTMGDIWPLSGLQQLHTRQFTVFIGTETCPECGGSGKYIGLRAVQPCEGCHGHGQIRWLPSLERRRS